MICRTCISGWAVELLLSYKRLSDVSNDTFMLRFLSDDFVLHSTELKGSSDRLQFSWNLLLFLLLFLHRCLGIYFIYCCINFIMLNRLDFILLSNFNVSRGERFPSSACDTHSNKFQSTMLTRQWISNLHTRFMLLPFLIWSNYLKGLFSHMGYMIHEQKSEASLLAQNPTYQRSSFEFWAENRPTVEF